jgi:hypothetical protein
MRRPNRRTSAETSIHVTQHAIDRYGQRTRRRISEGRTTSEIIEEVVTAIDLGLLFAAGKLTYLAPLTTGVGSPVCAVLEVLGPAEKPIAVTVCTIVTMPMTVATFGHVPGLLSAMSAVQALAA